MDASTALQTVAAALPHELQPITSELYALHEQRLWHELTTKLVALFGDARATKAIVPLYMNFVLPWHRKMNPLTFVKLSVITSRLLPNAEEALQLMQKVAEEMKELKGVAEGKMLTVFANMETAHYHLQLNQYEQVKHIIDENASTAESLAGVDSAIPASYYRVRADYDKAKLNFADYYRHALLYLACQPLSDLPLLEVQERAHDLCVSALLAPSIYNFGDLLQNEDLLKTLSSTQFAFLQDLVVAFNGGDHDSALPHFTTSIPLHPTLSQNIDGLVKKLGLMSLVEACFRQLKKETRSITYAELSAYTRIPSSDIERLLIKAISLNLVRGRIDEPQEVFIIEWVQSRVLDRKQIAELRLGIQAWRQRLLHTLSATRDHLSTTIII